MNRYQVKMPPGSEIARRSYCKCTGEREIVRHADGSTSYPHIVNADCPLHGNRPEHQLPEGL